MLLYFERCMQTAVNYLENWTNEWGFCFPVTKTQAICSNKRINPTGNIKMLEQTSVVRFLGI